MTPSCQRHSQLHSIIPLNQSKIGTSGWEQAKYP